MNLTPTDIRSLFDTGTFQRGESYARSGMVRRVLRAGDEIEGEVLGSGNSVYRQTIRLKPGRRGIELRSECSCPMRSGCKHVVAVLLTSAQQPGQTAALSRTGPALSGDVQHWLRQLALAQQQAVQAAVRANKVNKVSASHQLAYVLMPARGSLRPRLHLCKARLLANGGIGSASVVSDTYTLLADPPDYASDADKILLRLCAVLLRGMYYGGDSSFELTGALGTDLLTQLLSEQRLFWADSRADLKSGRIVRLHQVPPREACIRWQPNPSAPEMFSPALTGADGVPLGQLLDTEPMYCLHGEAVAQVVVPPDLATLPLKKLQDLLNCAPLLRAAELNAVAHAMVEQGLVAIVPPPREVEQRVRSDIVPTPCLLLDCIPTAGRAGNIIWQDYATLAFDYDGILLHWEDENDQVVRAIGGTLELIERDDAAEEAACEQLAEYGFDARDDVDAEVWPWFLPTPADWLAFARDGIAQLRAAGWTVQIGEGFRFDLQQVDDWYAELNEGAEGGNAWFELELGIVVNGMRQPLLPLLLQMIRHAPDDFNAAALAAQPDTGELLVQLPDAAFVALPWGRVKPILATMGELYFHERIGKAMRLPVLDVARLAELEQAAQLRWLGGERLRALGQRLNQFGGVQAIAAPAGLQAELRCYQSAGLAWMQFLREYEFGGILADDMGLGKTIQTLAHILVEKEAGRLIAPALVVAPTSLMANWQAEAARFAPGLRVLLLHGKDRAQHFDQIADADLVLTTYALLPRDEAALREREFHLLILDESQYIKNSKSKMAQTARLLRARHRLCLTGTPLQNHLGELWSQFHFLMPGLLGDEKTYNAEFRKPIEQHGDAQRSALLARRVKPFMLRRTKDKVATELPPKTEIVLPIELGSAQRDLYETVRLAMDKKVRAEIDKKGVARSQIVILDALLKLRQVCCDPRLVKSAGAAKSTAPSAKLEALLELVETLASEGRKILVFSQFTSMLALIAEQLRERSLDYVLLTGDTEDRATPVAAFQAGQVPLFLISLKAGGVGLNLTAADTVIHYDPWWNPAAENQATDRAWRMGQDKPVFVYKLIAQGTLEEKIQDLQRRKGELQDVVLADGGALDQQPTQEDLRAMFAG